MTLNYDNFYFALGIEQDSVHKFTSDPFFKIVAT